MYLRNIISPVHQTSKFDKQSKTHGNNSIPLLTSCGHSYCITFATECDWLPLHEKDTEGSVLLRP